MISLAPMAAALMLALPLAAAPSNTLSFQSDHAADRAALDATRRAMGVAFRNGDVAGVMALHHPDVLKALAYDRPLVGADAVAADLKASFDYARIDFIEDRIDDLAFYGDTAVQIASFAVRVTPRDGGKAQVFRGRSQVVWVRWSGSPTGWAAWREMVQPEP